MNYILFKKIKGVKQFLAQNELIVLKYKKSISALDLNSLSRVWNVQGEYGRMHANSLNTVITEKIIDVKKSFSYPLILDTAKGRIIKCLRKYSPVYLKDIYSDKKILIVYHEKDKPKGALLSIDNEQIFMIPKFPFIVYDGKGYNAGNELICYDIETGNEYWHKTVEDYGLMSTKGWIFFTGWDFLTNEEYLLFRVVQKNKDFPSRNKYYLVCANAKTGELIWRQEGVINGFIPDWEKGILRALWEKKYQEISIHTGTIKEWDVVEEFKKEDIYGIKSTLSGKYFYFSTARHGKRTIGIFDTETRKLIWYYHLQDKYGEKALHFSLEKPVVHKDYIFVRDRQQGDLFIFKKL